MEIKNIEKFEDLNLKQTFRAHIIYEQIMGHSFTGNDGLNGIVVLFYSYVLGSNKNIHVDYEDFMDWLDEHLEMLGAFSKWIIAINKAEKLPLTETPTGEEAGEDESKKA